MKKLKSYTVPLIYAFQQPLNNKLKLQGKDFWNILKNVNPGIAWTRWEYNGGLG